MRWVAVIVVLAVLAITTTISMGYVHVFRPIFAIYAFDDGLSHFLAMGAVSATVNLGFADARLFGRPLGVLGATLLVALGATLEELSQTFFPLRSVSLEDLLFGYLGIAVAATSVALVRRLRAEPA